MRGWWPLISLPILSTFHHVPVYGIIYCIALRVSTTGATYHVRITHFPRFLNTLKEPSGIRGSSFRRVTFGIAADKSLALSSGRLRIRRSEENNAFSTGTWFMSTTVVCFNS